MLKYFNDSSNSLREETIMNNLKSQTLTKKQYKKLKKAKANSFSYQVEPFNWTFLDEIKQNMNTYKFYFHCLMTIPAILVLLLLSIKKV